MEEKVEILVNAYIDVLKRRKEGIPLLFPKRDLKVHPLAIPIKRDPIKAKKLMGQPNKSTEAITKALS